MTLPTHTTASQEGDNVFAGNDTFKEINNIRFADQFAGADMGAQINAAIADLPAIGGIVDATGLNGAQTAAATININKRVLLKLGSVTLQLAGSPGINFSANGAALEGISPVTTTLQANAATNDVIQTNASNNTARNFSINSAVARSAGAGIRCKGGVGLFENFTIDKTWNGIQISDSGGASGLNSFRKFTMGQLGSPAGSQNVGIQIGPVTSGTVSGIFFDDGVMEATGPGWSTAMIVLDSGCDTIHFTNVQGVANVGGVDTPCVFIQNTSTAQNPSYCAFTACDFESGTTSNAIVISAGLVTSFTGCNIISSKVCFAVQGGKGLRIADCSFGNAQQNGVIVTGGTDLRITNNRIWDTSLASNGGFNAIDIAAAITDFTIFGNDFTTVNAPANNPFNNVKIAAGASNRYWVFANNFANNTGGGITDSGTGVSKFVGFNGSTLALAGATSGSTVLQAAAVASGTLTFPAATDQLVGQATTDTLSNKTLTAASSVNNATLLNFQDASGAITGTGAAATVFTYTLPASTIRASTGIRVKVWWIHGTGTASVTYQLLFGATAVVSSASATTGNGYAEAVIFNRPASTVSQRASSQFIMTGTSPVIVAGNNPGETTTNAIVVKLTFNVAATDAVTPAQWVVELIQ